MMFCNCGRDIQAVREELAKLKGQVELITGNYASFTQSTLSVSKPRKTEDLLYKKLLEEMLGGKVLAVQENSTNSDGSGESSH